MDLGHLAAYGRSTTRTAWATNPVRRVLWWLIAPYFLGAGVEIDRNVAAEVNKMRDFAAEIDKRMRDFAAEIDKNSRNMVNAAIATQLGGVRKDAMAVAHRLAGLEEEGYTASERITGIQQDAIAIGQRLAGLEGKDNIATERMATIQQDAKTVAQRIAGLEEKSNIDSELIAALRQEVHAAVQSLIERIDSLAHGASLFTHNRVATGQGGLAIAASPTGARFLVRQHDLIGRVILDGREWEPHVRMAIEHAARPDGIAVDAGAYIGVHTITMSRLFRTVHAFEPQRGIFQVLCGNLALNGRSNVVTHNAALYDRAGSMRLAPQERQEVNVPICDGQPDYDRIENAAALSFDFVTDGSGDVRAITLDDLALENVALIKVDTQGADLRVLQGAEGTIRRCRPTVLFEWERDLGLQHGAALDHYHAFFDGLGYDVATLHETTPGRQVDYIARPRERSCSCELWPNVLSATQE
jgi:FkbM family methyltransferase